MRDWRAEAERIETFANNMQTLEAAEASDVARQHGERVTRMAAEIVRLHHDALATDKAEAGNIYRTSWLILVVILSAAIGAAGFVFLSIHRSDRVLRTTAVELRGSAEHVLSASAQVASSAQVLSQGASSQAASLEETSASMEEMASMTRKNAENAPQAAGLMNEVATKVDESNQALTSMVHAMASIRDSSAKVSRIIKTIRRIRHDVTAACRHDDGGASSGSPGHAAHGHARPLSLPSPLGARARGSPPARAAPSSCPSSDRYRFLRARPTSCILPAYRQRPARAHVRSGVGPKRVVDFLLSNVYDFEYSKSNSTP